MLGDRRRPVRQRIYKAIKDLKPYLKRRAYAMKVDEVLKAALIASSEEYFSLCDISENKKSHRFSLVYRIRKMSI